MDNDLVKKLVWEKQKDKKDFLAGTRYLIERKGDPNCMHLYFQEGAEALDTYFACNKCGQMIYMLPGKDYSDFIELNREFINPELVKLHDSLKK